MSSQGHRQSRPLEIDNVLEMVLVIDVTTGH